MKKMMAVIGVVLIGCCVFLLKLSGFGTDPFSSMNMAVSEYLSISFGIWQLGVNIVLFSIMALRRKILHIRGRYGLMGFGTIVNMVFCGILVDCFQSIYTWMGGGELEFGARCVVLILAVFGICLGCSLYITADLGSAPYDNLGQEIADGIGKSFRICRTVTDLICVTISLIFGGEVGIATLIIACGTGSLVQFFHTKVSRPLLYRCYVKKKQRRMA